MLGNEDLAVQSRPPAVRPRIALYSHDAQGLGHVRRNLAIAGALAGSPLAPDVLLVSGTPYVRAFDLPPRTDSLSLPVLRKSPDGSYSGRFDVATVSAVRSQAIAGALEAFAPDLLIVDKLPRGMFDELEPALQRHRRAGGRAVLGLRDVLDRPETVAWEWQQCRATEAIAELYDEVWVYGDPRVYDPVVEYDLPASVAAKVRYTGYLSPTLAAARRIGPPLVLCLVGGGQDGYDLARAFVEADLPGEVTGVVVTGPFMPTEHRDRLMRGVAGRRDRRVVEFTTATARLLGQARAVVSMGGYNTVSELLAAEVPSLIVPRTAPRQEQLIRARRLAALGVAEVCPPDTLTSERITRWLARALHGHPRRRAFIDTDGLAVVPSLAATWCLSAVATEAGLAVS